MNVIQRRDALAVFLAGYSCLFASHAQESEPSNSRLAQDPSQQQSRKSEAAPGGEANARGFLKALLAKDEKALYGYGGGDDVFFASGKLRPEIRDFLYDSHGDWRSVIQIASEGDLQIVTIPQEEPANVVTVLFVPSKYRKDMDNVEFLRAEWMKKYFACEFVTNGSQWRLYANFCFAETDGPFPEDAG